MTGQDTQQDGMTGKDGKRPEGRDTTPSMTMPAGEPDRRSASDAAAGDTRTGDTRASGRHAGAVHAGNGPAGSHPAGNGSRHEAGPPKRGGWRRWPFVLAGGIIALFVIIVLLIVFVPAAKVWTNDAYVTAHYSVIAPRVPGQVVSVAVDDNQSVKAGDPLVQLDPRDYQTTLDETRATEAHDSALVLDAAASVARQPALIADAQARVAQLAARLLFARQNAARYAHLARSGAGSREEGERTRATLDELTASLHAAEAQRDAAQAQLRVLEAMHDSARRQVEVDRARVHQAELNLSYTTIRAPFDGMVGERTVQTGNYVPNGAALMVVVPMDQLWIEANYRELALQHMRPGQKARIHVDGYDIDLDGVVDSVPPASGAAFAPLAPENATGNFTKIVQRLPVKITLAPGQPHARLLRMGLSVETTVDTRLSNVVRAQTDTHRAVTDK